MIPEDYELLKNIFGKHRHILSNTLVGLYLEFIKDDEYFSDVSSKQGVIEGRIGNLNDNHLNVNITNKQTSVILCKLEDLEKATTEEYDELKRNIVK